jgi:outer membrane protein TolC
MLPTLNAYVSLTNHGLAGTVNNVHVQGLPYVPNPGNIFVGGYGTFFGQLLSRNFPDYSIGFNLNVPLRNGSARADMIKAQLDLREAQIQSKQQENSIKLAVVNSRISVDQARRAFETAVKARKLQEQTFAGTRRKYELGTASFLDVVVVQRDVVTAQSSEVNALRSYSAAQNNLDLVLGRILDAHQVNISEAATGKVKRP